MKALEVAVVLFGARAEAERHARDLLRSLLPDSDPDGEVVVVGDGTGTWILCARAYLHEGKMTWSGVVAIVGRQGKGNNASRSSSHAAQRWSASG